MPSCTVVRRFTVPQKLEWQASYAIDDAEIDAQHRMLFDLANRILAIMDPRQEFAELKAAMLALFDYMRVHFEAEEALMEEVEYPELAAHRKLHGTILEDMDRLIEDHTDLFTLKEALNAFMIRWVLTHIRHEDTKIGIHCKTDGHR